MHVPEAKCKSLEGCIFAMLVLFKLSKSLRDAAFRGNVLLTLVPLGGNHGYPTSSEAARAATSRLTLLQ